MTNSQISDHLSLVSKLMDLHAENSFKAKSFASAAFKIDRLEEELSLLSNENIFAIQGIGESLGKIIIDLLSTGKTKLLDDLLAKTPEGVLEIMHIKGLGPKKVSVIWKEMGIENIGELLYACNENRLLNYKGFGKATQEKVIESIEFYQKQQGFYLYAQIETLAEQLTSFLQKHLKTNKVSITGDFRRQEETIEVLEFVAVAGADNIESILSSFPEFGLIEKNGDSVLYNYDERIKIKLYPVMEAAFAGKLFTTTGSKSFMDALNTEYSSLSLDTEEDEEAIFKRLSMQYILPCLRETPQVIEKAKQNKIPALIQPGDIKGIIHSHSKWSDGGYTIEELVKAAIAKGLEYLVISDHSKAAQYAGGLNEDQIVAQHKQVDELNKKYPSFRVFKSIESDILGDGSLDYSDDVLSSFDLVIASVHSNLKMDEKKAMSRLMNAIENPYTIILGHMTGRLLLSRQGFPVDYKKVIDACAANEVVIELNAHPKRLDMRWQWLDYALEKNVLISINPDAHSIAEFDNTKYGVLAAQKGMLTKDRNLSSFSLTEFENFLVETRATKGI